MRRFNGDAAKDRGSAPAASVGVELQQALWSWRTHCDDGVAALGKHDVEGLDRALSERDALRPRIERLVGRLGAEGRPTRELLATLQRLQEAAAAAEGRLISLLQTEGGRLRREIEALDRGETAPAAYRLPEAPAHRLDIVR